VGSGQFFEQIKSRLEDTTSVGKLEHIQQWVGVIKTRLLRFNYTTGDAAGPKNIGGLKRLWRLLNG